MTGPMLDIYVTEGCEMCAHARALAARVREELPAVRVNIIDLTEDDDPPGAVFAVPSFLLDGRLISLGNPSWSALVSALAGGTTA